MCILLSLTHEILDYQGFASFVIGYIFYKGGLYAGNLKRGCGKAWEGR